VYVAASLPISLVTAYLSVCEMISPISELTSGWSVLQPLPSLGLMAVILVRELGPDMTVPYLDLSH